MNNFPESRPDSENGSAAPDRKAKSSRSRRQKNGMIIVLLFAVVMIFLSRSEPVNTIDCTPEIMAGKPDIIMLGAWWCSYCYQAKRYFQKNEIHYCEYDMENTETGKSLYQESGGGAIPVLLIGEYQLKGFNEQQIERALSLLDKMPSDH
jgi:glutaredoxin